MNLVSSEPVSDIIRNEIIFKAVLSPGLDTQHCSVFWILPLVPR